MKTWRNEHAGWVARLAAGLFLFQALLLGFSLGAHAAPMPLDRFGNVLCIGGDDASGQDGTKGSGHPSSGRPDCCSLGCGASGAGAVPPPAGASILAERPRAPAMPLVLSEDVGSGAAETPRSARAPPLPI